MHFESGGSPVMILLFVDHVSLWMTLVQRQLKKVVGPEVGGESMDGVSQVAVAGIPIRVAGLNGSIVYIFGSRISEAMSGLRSALADLRGRPGRLMVVTGGDLRPEGTAADLIARVREMAGVNLDRIVVHSSDGQYAEIPGTVFIKKDLESGTGLTRLLTEFIRNPPTTST